MSYGKGQANSKSEKHNGQQSASLGLSHKGDTLLKDSAAT